MDARRFLITGGSQGIGAALAFAADVSDPQDNERTVAFCHERMGGIDLLINNAGYAYRGEIGALDVGAMRGMFDVNVVTGPSTT